MNYLEPLELTALLEALQLAEGLVTSSTYGGDRHRLASQVVLRLVYLAKRQPASLSQLEYLDGLELACRGALGSAKTAPFRHRLGSVAQ